jgi:hypothetical protein
MVFTAVCDFMGDRNFDALAVLKVEFFLAAVCNAVTIDAAA